MTKTNTPVTRSEREADALVSTVKVRGNTRFRVGKKTFFYYVEALEYAKIVRL